MLRQALVLLLAITFATELRATNCKCQHHSAQANADGTCSRAEDANGCTLTFSSGSTAKKLPSDVLRDLNNAPPEKWSSKTLDELFTIVSLSQNQEGRRATELAFKKLRPDQNRELRRAFASQKDKATVFAVGDTKIGASYGCLAIVSPRGVAVLRTPWTPQRAVCDEAE